MRLALALALSLMPAATLAVGFNDEDPPEPTETTETCEEGLIWDAETERCLPPEESSNDKATLMQDARELAYAGRYADASKVLDLLEPTDPWVLTYRGFLARKAGQQVAAVEYYMAALERDPDLHLARSYMAQGFVEAGKLDAARAQLSQIRKRGGRSTWAELALRLALDRGRGFDY